VARNTGASCTATSGDETYTYDDAGNRLSAMQDATTRTFSYDADGQYSGAVHDATGRITEWGNWRFLGYDAEGRLTEVCDLVCSSGSQRYYFTYDADGRRTKIVEAGGGTSTTTELRYTADGHVSAEYAHSCDINGCGTPVLSREYVTDESGAIIKMIVPDGPDAGTYLVSWNGHGDALNLVKVAKGSATLANSFTYETWGAATVQTHNGFGDLGFRFRYVGQFGVQDDRVHGLPLLLMGARHYAPGMGRFIQPDPAALEENPYVYVANNPVSKVDPDGKWGFLVHLVVRAVVWAAPRVAQAAYRLVNNRYIRVGKGWVPKHAVPRGVKPGKMPRISIGQGAKRIHIHRHNWRQPWTWGR
jgi:RHS repeat-associated protein